jgi:ADP-ribose pyrophosphatase YjhB (NUDIX family)
LEALELGYTEWVRALVGKRKIFLVFSSVVLQDDKDQILLQRRTDFDFWGLPGGVLEVGEQLLACAYRELEEETGLLAGELRLVGIYTDPRYDVIYPNGDQVQQFTICFAGRLTGGKMKPDGVETWEQRFYDRQQLDSLNTPLWYRDMIQDALVGGPPGFSAPFASAHVEAQFPASGLFAGDASFIAVGAIAAVVRGDGRILTVRPPGSESWSLPGGHSLLGENAAHTVVRRTGELAGLVISPERLIGVYSSMSQGVNADRDQVQHVGAVFRARLALNPAQSEKAVTAHVAWMSPRRLLALANAQFKPLLAQIISHLDSGHFVC